MPAATREYHPAMPTVSNERSGRVHRVEVRRLRSSGDPLADRLLADARAIGIEIASAATAKVYLIEADFDDEQIASVRDRLLTDPVVEESALGAAASADQVVEVHPLPGVMDPAAQSVRDAIADLTGVEPAVSTGRRYELAGIDPDQARRLAERLLANPVVHAIHTEAFWPARLPHGTPTGFRLTHVPVRDLDDARLGTLSREAHLFLSLDEMRTIRDEFRRLGREPTDIELETLAQTWSEHCVHKTLKSTILYRGDRDAESDRRPDPIDWNARPGHTVNADGSVTIDNLLRSTVAAATHELIADGLDWTLSVFVDNAGIVAFDDDHAVCVKVETHNHPSAIEPYGGAATGIGGCIRDIIGTGLAARPIANTDVFCVAHPDLEHPPAGCLHPRRVLSEVVAGVRDYGNRMGIPTVNGAVWFDDRYVGNPLVFCGSVGVMPRNLISGDARPGDRIIALGGRTGRDGIHGATFSSAELTDTHADEFSHAVQIGNAIEEKRVLDAVLRARDVPGGPLFNAITDCGAGGFSSAVGEMGERIGAEVHLDRAPLKYDGLTYAEIWISEAQERMVLAVPRHNVDHLARICAEEHVEIADLGTFGTPDRALVLNYRGHEVGRLPMAFLHDGIPTPTRHAVWPAGPAPGPEAPAAVPASPATSDALLRLLAHPNIASKHWLIRQYDHEVQGNTVVTPLVGPDGRGPSDAAVIEPVPGTGKGLAIACGLATHVGDPAAGGDPYLMALAAIDECVRNLVCVGASPERIAILDNFCWPSCAEPRNLAALVRAAEGCYDGAKAYRTPFVSGKDSLNNQFTTEDGRTIEVPPTLLITGIGIVPELASGPTMDAKAPGHALLLVGPSDTTLRHTHYAALYALQQAERTGPLAPVDLREGPRTARAVARLVRAGLVSAAHDVSDGGVLCAVAEMLIAGSSPGAPIGFAGSAALDRAAAFGESPSRYLIATHDPDAVRAACTDARVTALGAFDDSGRLRWHDVDQPVESLAAAWRGTLDW